MKVWRVILVALVGVLYGSLAAAQSATPTSKLVWDQDGPDAASVQGYIYKISRDGAVPFVPLTGVLCASTPVPTTFTCSVNFPSFTPGQHTASVTAGTATADSLPSNVLAFTFVVVPTPPRNLRLGQSGLPAAPTG